MIMIVIFNNNNNNHDNHDNYDKKYTIDQYFYRFKLIFIIS